ncbi:hypothetical protein HNR60_001732 [Rhodopseudomonas rhenobacensis]|uniref:Uncharacterized protein n=1 Tax=Rhodopseudomonas rhenobacensis TaxID=87461 RepID=A0A7W8DYI9_9BRAD|nr:hypothetical protein [Rhodopseudomonas rhenobacensis]MBB5046983.1 hypothetical protein [Rhodopseudomonas rhenobacensis]
MKKAALLLGAAAALAGAGGIAGAYALGLRQRGIDPCDDIADAPVLVPRPMKRRSGFKILKLNYANGSHPLRLPQQAYSQKGGLPCIVETECLAHQSAGWSYNATFC